MKTHEHKMTLKTAVCMIFEIDEQLLFSPTRERPIMNARQCFLYFVVEMGGNNLSNTGRYIRRTHATVINALQRFGEHYRTEAEYRTKVDKVFDLFYTKQIKMPYIHKHRKASRIGIPRPYNNSRLENLMRKQDPAAMGLGFVESRMTA